MDRRSFITSLAAIGCVGALEQAQASPIVKMAGKAGAKVRKGGFDENLVVFISDLHCNPTAYQPGRLRTVVDEILAMKPLPRNVIALGDLAYLTGQVSEYTALKPLLEPIEKAGITLTLAMGNHDRREEFRQVFPEHAAKSVFKDRYTYIVETPHADIIVLDSLQQGEDKTTWITPGELNDEQREWLEKTLAGYTKPVFVSSHHPVGELKIGGMLINSPACRGYIHGHDHRWRKDWLIKNYSDTRTVRTLCLPSTGHWGDIGYTCFRISDTKAVAQITEKEFFFPTPVDNPADEPKQWKLQAAETDGETCTFAY